MPGFLGGGQNAQPKQPFGPQLKQALVTAAPMFNAMAAGYSSGRGPYAYLDQGAAGMQAMMKQKRDEEAAAAAAAAFGGLMPGGLGGAVGGASGGAGMRGTSGGASAPITFDKNAPQYIADDAMAALGKSPMSMEGKIREGLKARGMPEHVANAFIANFKDESNLNPGINEAAPVVPGSRGGFGLAQWTGPRRRALEAFASETGRPVDDLNVQLDFLMQELQGPEARAGATIMSAKNAPEAAAAIVNSFLRPAEENRSRREAAYLGMDGSGAQSVADPLADPYVQRLMQVMAMPGLTPEQRSVVELQLQTRIGQLTAQATPTEYTTFNGPDGMVYRFDKQRGVAEPLTGAEQADPGYRVLTSQEAQAMGLPEGVYQVGPKGEIKPIGGGGTNITVNTGGGPELGKLSTDFGYVLDPETREPKIDPATGLPMAAPVPGSPAWIEAQRLADKAATGADKEAQTADVVLGKLDELDALVSGGGIMSPATGFGAETLAGVGGTRAADTKATIDTIAANMAFDALAGMRAASPTGGALGQITEKELDLLSSTLASLKQSQSPEQFKRNVAQLREIYTTIRAKADAYPNAAQFGFGGGSSQGAAQGATAPTTGITSYGVQWSRDE